MTLIATVLSITWTGGGPVFVASLRLRDHVQSFARRPDVTRPQSCPRNQFSVGLLQRVGTRHRFDGHVFHRFRPRASANDRPYVTRYVHLNPVRAGIVDIPGMQWSSYRRYAQDRDVSICVRELLAPGLVRRRPRSEPPDAYRRYVAAQSSRHSVSLIRGVPRMDSRQSRVHRPHQVDRQRPSASRSAREFPPYTYPPTSRVNDPLPSAADDHIVCRSHLARRLVSRHLFFFFFFFFFFCTPSAWVPHPCVVEDSEQPTPVHRPGTATLAIRPPPPLLWSTETRAAAQAR